jgi:hypothetical protein
MEVFKKTKRAKHTLPWSSIEPQVHGTDTRNTQHLFVLFVHLFVLFELRSEPDPYCTKQQQEEERYRNIVLSP